MRARTSTYLAPSSWVAACPAPPSCRCSPPGGGQLCRGGQVRPRRTGTGGCSISSAAWGRSADASCPSSPPSSECQCPSSESLCTWWVVTRVDTSVSRSFQAVWNKVEKLSQGCLPLSLHLTQAHVHLDLFFRKQSLLYVSFYTTEQERSQNLHKKKKKRGRSSVLQPK